MAGVVVVVVGTIIGVGTIVGAIVGAIVVAGAVLIVDVVTDGSKIPDTTRSCAAVASTGPTVESSGCESP